MGEWRPSCTCGCRFSWRRRTWLAIDALTFGTYVLQPFFPDSQTPPEIPVRLMAAVIILFLAWLNIRSVKASVVLQNVLMFPKFVILGAITIVGIYRLATSPSSSFNDSFANTFTGPATIATAFYQGLYTYNGWDNITCVVEEVKKPTKTLLAAMSTALILLITLYLLVNVAYFAVLEPGEILFSPAVAVTFGRESFGVMAWSVPVFVAVSTVGSLNGKTLTQSRVVFVGARHGQLPASLALVGKRCTPVTAIIFMSAIALLYLVTVDIFALINVVSFSSTLCQVGVISGLLHLRRKRPNWERPFKVWTVVAVGLPGGDGGAGRPASTGGACHGGHYVDTHLHGTDGLLAPPEPPDHRPCLPARLQTFLPFCADSA
ncbi:Y+L amino acid transporter 2-like [Scylla paramamosain]|uniref:Y+L amino acid transporter 2-like n=1 Tax=Scylla paramamosain TaxID=85552 RepID=UPI003082A1F9